MKQLQNKISDQRGASILMSMLLMLVSIMVCVVGLNAATSALDARKNAINEQQEYLTVSSAAELFIDALQDLEFEAYHYEFYGPNGSWETVDMGGGQTVSVWTKNTSIPYIKYWYPENENGTFSKSGTFVDMLNYAVQFIRKSEVANASLEETFTIQTDQTDSLANVNMTLKMDKRFAVTATFALATDKSYQIQVKAVPVLTGKSFSGVSGNPEHVYEYSHLFDQERPKVDVAELQTKTNTYLTGKSLSSGSLPPEADYFGTTECYMKLQWNSISVTKGGTQ